MTVFIHMSWQVIIVPHQEWTCHLLHTVCHWDGKAWALKLKMALWTFLRMLIAWLGMIWAAELGVFLQLSLLTDTFTSHPFIYCTIPSGSSIIPFLKMTVGLFWNSVPDSKPCRSVYLLTWCLFKSHSFSGSDRARCDAAAFYSI